MDNLLYILCIPVLVSVISLIIEYWIIQPLRSHQQSSHDIINSNTTDTSTKQTKASYWRILLIFSVLSSICCLCYGASNYYSIYIDGSTCSQATPKVNSDNDTPEPTIQADNLDSQHESSICIKAYDKFNDSLKQGEIDQYYLTSYKDNVFVIVIDPINNARLQAKVYAYEELLNTIISSNEGEALTIEINAKENVRYDIYITSFDTTEGGYTISMKPK